MRRGFAYAVRPATFSSSSVLETIEKVRDTDNAAHGQRKDDPGSKEAGCVAAAVRKF